MIVLNCQIELNTDRTIKIKCEGREIFAGHADTLSVEMRQLMAKALESTAGTLDDIEHVGIMIARR